MSAKTTRRAFVGGGVALAAGVGVVKLPDLIGRTRHSNAYEVVEISGTGSAPEFGTLLPASGARSALFGKLRERGSSRIAGQITMTSIPSNAGMVQVHTLDLHDGTVVAIGPDTGSIFNVASGTGAYAGAQGRVTIQGAATAAPSVVVDLEI